jgi:hypothetical protein
MNTRPLILAIVIFVRSGASAEDSFNQPALIAAMEEVEKALRSRDEPTLRKRLAEDFVMVHTAGAARDTRDRFIHSLIKYGRQGSDVRTTTYDREIRLLSPGLALVLSTEEDRAGDKSRWFTHTSIWRDKSGYWQVIYGHRALIGEGKPQTPESLAGFRSLTGRYKTSDGREFAVSINGDRLMMSGPRHIEQHNVLIPQGGLEFLATGYRLEFSVEGTQPSATAVQNGKIVWTATKAR